MDRILRDQVCGHQIEHNWAGEARVFWEVAGWTDYQVFKVDLRGEGVGVLRNREGRGNAVTLGHNGEKPLTCPRGSHEEFSWEETGEKITLPISWLYTNAHSLNKKKGRAGSHGAIGNTT